MGLINSKKVKTLALAGVLMALGAIGLRWARPSAQASAAAAAEYYVLDVWAEQVLGLQLPERSLAVRGPMGEVALGPTALSARFLPSGEVVYINDDLALYRLNPATGATVELLPEGSANAPLFVSPDGRSLAYLKPRDITTREEVLLPLSNGIAVLNLDTGQELVLLEVPDVTVNLYGWAGDQLIIQIPTWDPVTLALPDTLQLAALAVTDPPTAPQPLAELPRFAPDTGYPQTSLDQRFLAYETTDGLVVAALAPGGAKYAYYKGLSEPQWTNSGLNASQDGAKSVLRWSEDDADLDAAAPKTLAWPPAAPEVASPASSHAPNATLFFRPVSANTRVSAYMDLNTASGAIRDWTGWQGGGWVYGHAYDGHWGTDYDGVTGNPVTAPATGTVNRVIFNCANTFPGGPATFGTSVRLDHGVLSDGLHYWTLVGHLKCDGVAVTEGQTVTGLPTFLAQMGNTGWSTGDHTHLQVYRSQGHNVNAAYTIDPYEWGLISDQPPLVAPPTPTAPPSTTGDVVGTVRDAQNQPAPGAQVKLQLAGKIFAALTGADGRYAFTGLPPGAATLRAVRGGRWGSAAGSVQVAQVLGGDIGLTQCSGQATTVDACPALVHDQAVFVTDVTLDDGTVVGPGQVLTKIWRLRNTGTTVWGSGYQMVFVSGNREANTPQWINVPSTAVNATVDLSLTMTAAGATGTHRGYWRLRNPQGVFFGPTFWVELYTQPGGQVAKAAEAQAWDETAERNGQAAAPHSPSAAGCVVSAPASSSASTFTVSWSGSPNGASIVSYDVQYLDSNRGAWRDWVRGYPAGQTSAPFTGQVGHAYGFRCRATDTAPSTGAYPGSADATTLVGSLAGTPDLRFVGFQVRPAPGGGLLATVVVQNAGTVGTQRGFFVDLYRNDAPGGQHDYAGIVNTWVNEPLGAGASLTLNYALTEPAGNADLYAQVDTGNLIPETDEGNNVQGTAASGCVLPEDGYEFDDVPGAAQPLPVGASQARNFGGPSEQDWAALTLTPGRLYRIETSALGAAVDTRLAVYNAAGTTRLAFNDDSGSNTSLASRLYFAPRTGTNFLLLVDNWNPATGGCGATYSLSLTDLGIAQLRYLPVALMK